MNFSVNLHGIHNEIDPSMEFRGQLFTLKNSIDFKFCEIFHCDGLILCVIRGKPRLVVWNPCTGETRWIKRRTSHKSRGIHALGYGNIDSSCRSYKILRFSCYYYNERVDVAEFYDFSSDSWRVLDVLSHDWSVVSLGVSLKEKAYWIAFDKETGFFLLGFDFTTERFEHLPLPFQSHNDEDSAILSVVKDERLSVLYQNLNEFSEVPKIWVSNTKDMSWSNFLVVDFDKFALPSLNGVISFFLDEENKVAVCCDTADNTRIYIVGEGIYKEVHQEITKRHVLNWPLLVTYVPSLVRIQKNTIKRQKKMKQKEVGTGGHLRKER